MITIDNPAAVAIGLTLKLRGQSAYGPAPTTWESEENDSAFRHLLFCFAGITTAMPRMAEVRDVVDSCRRQLIAHALAEEFEYFVLGGPSEFLAEQAALSHLERFSEGWRQWLVATTSTPIDDRAGTATVCQMLRYIESSSKPMTDADLKRLWSLASWFEDWIRSIDGEVRSQSTHEPPHKALPSDRQIFASVTARAIFSVAAMAIAIGVFVIINQVVPAFSVVIGIVLALSFWHKRMGLFGCSHWQSCIGWSTHFVTVQFLRNTTIGIWWRLRA